MSMELIEPTEEERRNGWDAETLTEYVNGRLKSQAQKAGILPETYTQWGDRIDPNRPVKSQSNYDPLRW